MMRVLFLDDEDWRHRVADERWSEAELWHARTVQQFRNALDGWRFDVVSLDHDLGDGEDGKAAVRHLVGLELDPKPRVIVHSWNPVAAPIMVDDLIRAGFDVKREMFSAPGKRPPC